MEQSIFKLSIEYGGHCMRSLENVKKNKGIAWGGNKTLQFNTIDNAVTFILCPSHTFRSPGWQCPLQLLCWERYRNPSVEENWATAALIFPDAVLKMLKGEILVSPISPPNMENSTEMNEICVGNRSFLYDQVRPKFCSKRKNFHPL